MWHYVTYSVAVFTCDEPPLTRRCVHVYRYTSHQCCTISFFLLYTVPCVHQFLLHCLLYDNVSVCVCVWKATSKPRMSEARRKVRQVLCKSKGDPHYFSNKHSEQLVTSDWQYCTWCRVSVTRRSNIATTNSWFSCNGATTCSSLQMSVSFCECCTLRLFISSQRTKSVAFIRLMCVDRRCDHLPVPSFPFFPQTHLELDHSVFGSHRRW